jgi:hypothetical protein
MKKDNKVVEKLIDIIVENHDINFEDIDQHDYFEDKRVPGQYAIRLFIAKDSIDFAVRHAQIGKPFNIKKDVVEANFISWPPQSIEFNEIFEFCDHKNKSEQYKE